MVSRAFVLLMVLACVSLPFALAEEYGDSTSDGYAGEEQYSDEQYPDEQYSEEPEHYSSGCSSYGYGYAQAAAEEPSDAEVNEYVAKVTAGAIPEYTGKPKRNGQLCMWNKECCTNHCADNKCCDKGKRRNGKACTNDRRCCSGNCRNILTAVATDPRQCCRRGTLGFGAACTLASQCCSGTCTIVAPATAGTCA